MVNLLHTRVCLGCTHYIHIYHIILYTGPRLYLGLPSAIWNEPATAIICSICYLLILRWGLDLVWYFLYQWTAESDMTQLPVYTVRKVIKISAYNIKSSGKHDTTWNILRCITFSPLHFMLYRGKSISSGTVCSVLLSFSSIKQSAFVWYCDTRISRSANDYKGNRLSFSYFLIQYCGGLV